jgi:hypothetical protein
MPVTTTSGRVSVGADLEAGFVSCANATGCTRQSDTAAVEYRTRHQDLAMTVLPLHPSAFPDG